MFPACRCIAGFCSLQTPAKTANALHKDNVGTASIMECVKDASTWNPLFRSQGRHRKSYILKNLIFLCVQNAPQNICQISEGH
jgi:hypothetical protein